MQKVRKRQFTFSAWYMLLALAVFWVISAYLTKQKEPRQVPYSELVTMIESGRVQEASVRADEIVAVLKPAKQGAAPELVAATRLPGVDEAPLVKEMRAHAVVVTGKIEKTSWLATAVGWFLPLLLLFAFWTFTMRRMGRGAGPLNVGKANAKIYDLNEKERITFEDVAGVDEAEAELVEIVSYLKEPTKYQAIGARVPRGALLVGPPGTGKTLLARAVAGEAGVPFFSMSGSEFVQMFVGVGAARVRDLFEEAKRRAPCIVFIDELDAIGRSRAGVAGGFGVHEEREQTLNQLLIEMDGFDSSKGVVILAATNRPEVLDQALLRAGRFDRQVVVDRPDVKGREAILRVHVRKVQLGPDVDLHVVAQRTPGMAGADLANVVNEAALAAARGGRSRVELRDFEEAVDRLQLGLKKQGRVMNAEERQRVAYHESGHALVALSVEHADPVHRVTIIPRSIGALGATLQLPAEERYLMTRAELRDRICVMLGGRAAEEVALSDISTGAQNDLERATETARQMVSRFGMSEKLGPLTYGPPGGGRNLEGGALFPEARNFSEETARAIDDEVRAIVEAERARARRILETRREVLEAIAKRLLVDETIERATLEELARKAA